MAITHHHGNKLTPLIPLEYCSPERAARMLGCEVEDIFHWASRRMITIYAEFYENELYQHGSDGFLVRETIVGAGPSPIAESRTSTSFFIRDLNDDMSFRTVNLYGLWTVEHNSISRMISMSDSCELVYWDLYSENSYLEHWDIYARNPGLIDFITGGHEREVILSGVKVAGMKDRFRIIHEDMKKIQKHMFSGEMMDKMETDRTSHNNYDAYGSNEQNHVAERHAKTREIVLAAAIRALNEWPDECRGKDGQMNGTAWANAIHDHSVALFGSESAPLSLPSTTKLLNTAIKGGVVHKKK